MRKKKKKKHIDLIWNKKRVRVFFNKRIGWEVASLEGQNISQNEKLKIIKAVLCYDVS